MVAVLLLAHVLWAPALAESSIADFVIIGIDHPLDMESRSGTVRQQIYLRHFRANGSAPTVGTRLVAYRSVSQKNVGQTQDEERVQVPNALIDDGDGASNGDITIPDGQTKTLTLNVPIKLVPLEPKPPVGVKRNPSTFPDDVSQRPSPTSEHTDAELIPEKVEGLKSPVLKLSAFKIVIVVIF